MLNALPSAGAFMADLDYHSSQVGCRINSRDGEVVRSLGSSIAVAWAQIPPCHSSALWGRGARLQDANDLEGGFGSRRSGVDDQSKGMPVDQAAARPASTRPSTTASISGLPVVAADHTRLVLGVRSKLLLTHQAQWCRLPASFATGKSDGDAL